MKTILFSLVALVSMATFAQDCSELFISEYVEGWSNNKSIEIYNPTNTSVDLSNYYIARYSNGANTASASNAVQLSGTIAPLSTFVVTLDKRDPNGTGFEAPIWDSLQVRTDLFVCPDYNASDAMYFNGDDALVLGIGTVPVSGSVDNLTPVDIFGKIGQDPGAAWTSESPYTGDGAEVTKDHSLIRKSEVLRGETNPNITSFNPLAQWDSIPATYKDGGLTFGNWNTLGSHDCECATLGVNNLERTISMFPNPSSTEFAVTGESSITSVTVFSLSGVEQSIESILQGTSVSVSHALEAGVYLVQITFQNGDTSVQRLSVK